MKTLDVAVWHVLEYEHSLLDEISHGQFHEADTYVIKWHYMITQAGACSLILLPLSTILSNSCCVYCIMSITTVTDYAVVLTFC